MNTEDFQLFIQGEYDRLLSDLSEPENHSLLDLISYRVLCESHAEEVLAKSKEVLLAVDKIILTHDILPDKKEYSYPTASMLLPKCCYCSKSAPKLAQKRFTQIVYPVFDPIMVQIRPHLIGCKCTDKRSPCGFPLSISRAIA